MSSSQKKHSLSRDYLIILSIIATVIVLSLAFTWSVYYSKERSKNQLLQKQTNRIERELNGTFDYAGHLMQFLGEQIAHDPDDLEKTMALLRNHLLTNDAARKQYSWVMFDWINLQNQMIVSTVRGIIPNPKSAAHRYYVQVASKEPWKLHFDSPDFGLTSGEWVIPAGMGITDGKGSFIGTLSMAFNIAKFSQKIEALVDTKEISFIVVDNNNKIAFYSSDNKPSSVDITHVLEELKENGVSTPGSGFLYNPIRYGTAIYPYYTQLEHYPYTLFVGYNTGFAAKDLYETLLPGIGGICILGAVALTLLLLFRHSVINPIIRLSEAVDRMAEGEVIHHIDGCKTYEINNLNEQILKINQLIQTDNHIKEQLRKAIIIAKAADREKENFLKDVCNALRQPLKTILNEIDLIRSYHQGNNQTDVYTSHLHSIYKAADQLCSYTTDTVCPTEVDIMELLKSAIIIQKKMASENNLELTSHIQPDIPMICADRLMLQQILLSTLHESISYTPSHGCIHIHAYTEAANSVSPATLVIQIKDNGIGLDKEERREYLQLVRKYSPENSDLIDSGQLTLQMIEQLVTLHKGTFSLETRKAEGSTFTIRLPYLNKKSFPSTSKPSNQTYH